MNTVHKPLILILLAVLLTGSGSAYAEIVFSETFDQYDARPANYGKYYGLPEQGPTGSDEFWYGGRFNPSGSDAIQQDIAVLKAGGANNSTPVGRVEDSAALLFRLDPGYENITLSFEWRTYSVNQDDCFVAGYFIGDPGFDTEANRFQNLYLDGNTGSPYETASLWDTEWTELTRGRNNQFTSETFSLPSSADEAIWVAFWLDGEEGDYGKLDNILVDATFSPDLVPEPGTAVLIAFAALVAKAFRSFRQRFTFIPRPC